MGFFHYKLLQKLTQPCVDASQGVTNFKQLSVWLQHVVSEGDEGL